MRHPNGSKIHVRTKWMLTISSACKLHWCQWAHKTTRAMATNWNVPRSHGQNQRFTSVWSSHIISYMSSRTNSFSGDRLLIAIASPKLSSVAKLFFVIAAKHLSLKDWLHSKTWSQSWRSPAKRSLTYSKQRQMSPDECYTITEIWEENFSYSNSHEMNPVSYFRFQNLPRHFLHFIFAQFFNTQVLQTWF